MTLVSELFSPGAAGPVRLFTLVALTLNLLASTEGAAVQANPTRLTFQATIGSSNPRARLSTCQRVVTNVAAARPWLHRTQQYWYDKAVDEYLNSAQEDVRM